MVAQLLQGYALNLVAGMIGGIFVGHMAMKVTRKAGVAAGVGIIGYEVAHHNGLIKTSLDTVVGKSKAGVNSFCSKYCTKTTGQMKSIVGKNKALAVGFVGGSLLGIACS
ncbi:hypothetical protein HHI36_003625 [Cryptolaemus montrouzieri]|uniref:Uncharacterized protein n=1 Tax=Cryptolaemus montrouzieri TaxID=559131 RepID=A0ABD2PDW6_9CUCU